MLRHCSGGAINVRLWGCAFSLRHSPFSSLVSRQKMSFAMWHLLLHRTGVKLVSIVEIDAKKT